MGVLIELVGDSDGEVRVISSFWESEIYLPIGMVSNSENFYPIDSETVVALKIDGGFKKYIKNKTLKRDNYLCVYCGNKSKRTFRPTHKLTGGKEYSLANSVTCCEVCVSEQSTKQIADNPVLRDPEAIKIIKERIKDQRIAWKKYCISFNKKIKKKNKSIKTIELPQFDTILFDSGVTVVKDSKLTIKKKKGVLYTDASVKEGKATLASVIYCNNEIIHKSYQTIELSRNSEAELEAILTGLKIAEIMNIDIQRIYTDCQSAANVIGNEIEPRQSMVDRELAIEIRNIVKPSGIEIQWIPRTQNEVADTVSRKILVAI